MKNNYLHLLLFLISNFAIAQTNEKLIKGRILTGQIPVENVEVINISNQRTAITNAKGEFQIMAKTSDPLIYSNSNYENIRKRVLKSEFESGQILVSLIPIATNLDEVVINKETGVTGFEAQKKFSVAERRLETGNKQFRLNQGLEISNDAIINKISGKSKRLKREVEVEKKEAFLEEFSDTFPVEFFTDDLKIDKDYVEGFKFYLADDKEFVKAFHASSDQEFGAMLLKKTDEYKQVIANEK
jgi:hypothetical protein